MHKAIHQTDDRDKLYLLRKGGERRLTSINDSMDG